MAYHKNIRIDRHFYKTPGRVISLTICLKRGKRYFEKDAFSKECLKILNELSLRENIGVLAYCLMPDHLHLLVKVGYGSDIIGFVQKLKSLISRLSLKCNEDGKIWLKTFYDHFLRKEESINEVIKYILNNPVRKNIVSHWKNYNLSGTIFEID